LFKIEPLTITLNCPFDGGVAQLTEAPG